MRTLLFFVSCSIQEEYDQLSVLKKGELIMGLLFFNCIYPSIKLGQR